MEEDIKILEDFLNYKNKVNENYHLIAISHKRLCEAIEHLIARNKELEEENLHWKGQYHLLSRKIDVIPKSKIKEKIEELKEDEKNKIYSLNPDTKEVAHININHKEEIEVLQELLED